MINSESFDRIVLRNFLPLKLSEMRESNKNDVRGGARFHDKLTYMFLQFRFHEGVILIIRILRRKKTLFPL